MDLAGSVEKYRYAGLCGKFDCIADQMGSLENKTFFKNKLFRLAKNLRGKGVISLEEAVWTFILLYRIDLK